MLNEIRQCACGCGTKFEITNYRQKNKKYAFAGHSPNPNTKNKKNLNEMTFCQCGCGQQRTKYTKKGYLAKYIQGHYKPLTSKINSQIDCGCGCGTQIWKFDAEGRPRIYVNGHTKMKFNDPKEDYLEPIKKEYHKLYNASKTERGRNQKISLIEMFGGECQDCHIKYNKQNAVIFQFHHRDESEKKFALSQAYQNKSWDAILEEVKKCDLICGNCHSLRHGDIY